ncbi:UNVERIFIED_CONTAM: hypothetical protein K2H54_004858 [Gekko kuhli]
MELETMSRYTSPVNPAVFPHLTVVLLAIGMFFTAWFFVYPPPPPPPPRPPVKAAAPAFPAGVLRAAVPPDRLPGASPLSQICRHPMSRLQI